MAVAAAAISAVATSAIYQSGTSSGNVAARHRRHPAKTRALEDDSVMGETDAERVFKELSVSEVQIVARTAAAALGCDRTYVDLSSCFLTGAEAVSLKLPPKDQVLLHLDQNAPPPPRYAEVMVAHGNRPKERGLGIYEVGPLDGKGGLSNDASVAEIRYLHWDRRPLQFDDRSMDPAVTRALKPIAGLLVSVFGPIFPNIPESFNPQMGVAMYWTGANVFSRLGNRSSRFWFNWFKDPDEFQVSWLHTLPLSFDMSHEGPPETWTAVNYSYCGQFFPTIDAFVDGMGTVQHCNGTQGTQYSWDVPGPDPGRPATTTTFRQLEAVPTQTWKVSPGGSIRWGDWELVATVRPASGLALHDVRFRGERILYELSLSDCHAYYAGPRPEKQYHFSDKAYSMTQISGDLKEGLDCPEGASFVEAALWLQTFRNASSKADPGEAKGVKVLCVFESNGFEGSSWRHTQLLNRNVSGRPKRVLVIRHIGTVGNYDYITEVHLREDGGVNVKESFAGYPEVDRSFEAFTPNWGSTVRKGDASRGNLVQNLHSHYCAFKVDLDILGTQNEFHSSRVKHEDRPSSGTIPQKIIETRRIDKEDANWDMVATAHYPGVWRIVNPQYTNARSGNARGYAIVITSAPSVQSFDRSHPFAMSSTFARRHLAVAKRKEDEPTATSVLDFYPVTDPELSVDRFLSDGDDLVNQDLVCWVSVGKEHASRTEDQPLISNMAVEFNLVPWDYFEENPEMVLAMTGKGPEELLSSTELRGSR
jgi:hypothetical protein